MESLGFGQILLFIFFILVSLINFVMQRVRRRLEDKTPAEQEPPAQVLGHPQTAPASQPSRRASRKLVRELRPQISSIPPSRRYFAKRSLQQTARDARRGIILMTVLGPCRAFNPLD